MLRASGLKWLVSDCFASLHGAARAETAALRVGMEPDGAEPAGQEPWNTSGGC